MHFDGELRLPGRARELMDRFSDVERMAQCVPGAVIERKNEDGSYASAMVVSFGPKKIRFQGRTTCDLDMDAHTGTLRSTGSTDMRGSRYDITTHFRVIDDAADSASAPQSTVRIDANANFLGVLAAVANAGGVVVGNALMQEFAQNLARAYAAPALQEGTPARDTAANANAADAADGVNPAPPATAPSDAPNLSVTRLLVAALRERWRALRTWAKVVKLSGGKLD